MLRYLYLLSLLLYIQLSFCYNYIDETSERTPNKYGRNVRKDRERKLRRPKERKNLLRQEYDYDRSPVEFDVASFIQPDEEAVEDDEVFRNRNKKRRRTPKNYDYLVNLSVDDTSKKSEKSPDYLNIGESNPELHMSPPLFKDSINSKHINFNPLDELSIENKYGHEKFKNMYKDELLLDQNLIHNHQKKCALKHIKNIKFPFFSHNKSETITKPKKNKKRKLFCFNCPKKDDRGKVPAETKMGDDPIMQYKMKRSYQEKLCPACKKLFVAIQRGKKTPRRIIHTGRQYYQNFPEPRIKEDVKNLRSKFYSNDLDSLYRRKREEDRERQLKELEEVEKKVENVNVNVPTFEKPTSKDT